MFVTDKLNIGANANSGYVVNSTQSNKKGMTEEKNSSKEAELLLSENARQKTAMLSGDTQIQDIWSEEYNFTPQEAYEQVRISNERILNRASDAVLAQANQDVNRVTELLSA